MWHSYARSESNFVYFNSEVLSKLICIFRLKIMHGRRARMEQIAAVTKQHENSQPPPTPEKEGIDGGESKDGSKDLEKSEPDKKTDDIEDLDDESGNESEGTTAEVEVPEEVNEP
jgi:hypothetical protein